MVRHLVAIFWCYGCVFCDNRREGKNSSCDSRASAMVATRCSHPAGLRPIPRSVSVHRVAFFLLSPTVGLRHSVFDIHGHHFPLDRPFVFSRLSPGQLVRVKSEPKWER